MIRRTQSQDQKRANRKSSSRECVVFKEHVDDRVAGAQWVEGKTSSR